MRLLIMLRWITFCWLFATPAMAADTFTMGGSYTDPASGKTITYTANVPATYTVAIPAFTPATYTISATAPLETLIANIVPTAPATAWAITAGNTNTNFIVWLQTNGSVNLRTNKQPARGTYNLTLQANNSSGSVSTVITVVVQ